MIYDIGDNDLGDIVDLTNDGDEENGSEEKKAELLQVAMLENEKKEVGANDQINDNTTTNNNMTMNLQTTSNQPTPKLLTPKPPPSPLASTHIHQYQHSIHVLYYHLIQIRSLYHLY